MTRRSQPDPKPRRSSADSARVFPVTTVIPCFQAADTIARAVASALSQNRGAIRVITVIDGPCADTQRIVERLNDPRVSLVVNQTNLGAPASRNRGLGLATSPYISFLDADDYFEGDLLGPLVALMQEEKADLGFGPSVHLHPQYTRRFGPDYVDHEDAFVRWFSGIQNVNTASVAWSASYLRSIGGWDEAIRRNQDGELALRAILLGARFARSFEAAGVWVNNSGGARITSRTDNLGALIDVVDKFEKMRSDVVPDSARLFACGCRLRRIAMLAYRAGDLGVAAEAMARRRRLGFPDPKFDTDRLMAALANPLSPKQREAAWRAASRVKGWLVGNRRAGAQR